MKKDNVIIFPSIFEQKSFIDLKEASRLTGLQYSLLYKIVVQNKEISHCRFGRKIVMQISDIKELMSRHFIGAVK